jgi:hypothetical protein
LEPVLGAVGAMLAALLVGRLLRGRTRGRREAGIPDVLPSTLPGPTEPSRLVPSQQAHAFGLRVRADQRARPRLVDADAVVGARVALTTTPDPTLDPVLVEELS